MTDSTCVAAPVPSGRSSEKRREQEARRRDRVRREATRGLRDDAVGEIVDRVYKGTPGRLTRRSVAAAHISFQTALALAGMWEERRPMREGEAATFRMLGGLATRAGVTAEAALAAMDTGWEVVVGRARRGTKGGPWSHRDGASTACEFDREARAFAEAVTDELRAGLDAEAQFVHDQEYVVLCALDGTITGDELGAAASAAALDASRPHGVALLVSPVGRSADVAAAAAAVRESVPHVLDLGPGNGLPPHHRLVVPMITSAQWVEARTTLHDIGTRHHVLVVAPAAAPTLASLHDSHQLTHHGLGWTVATCGYRYGIIDPACLAPQAEFGEASRPERLRRAPTPVPVRAA
jgi:hypothetical protein